MLLNVLKGKIHRARVVQAELDYVGSITVDTELAPRGGHLGVREGAGRRYRQRQPLRDLRHRRRAGKRHDLRERRGGPTAWSRGTRSSSCATRR